MIEQTTKINHIKNIIIGGISLLGSAVIDELGGWDYAMQTLLIFIALDYLCGIILAAVFKKSRKSPNGKLDSRESRKGLFTKVGILMAVIVGVHLDNLLGLGQKARNAIIFFYMINEGISITENLALMGVPIPKPIINMLEQLQDSKLI